MIPGKFVRELAEIHPVDTMNAGTANWQHPLCSAALSSQVSLCSDVIFDTPTVSLEETNET